MSSWQDKASMGTIVAIISVEEMLVLWSREPFHEALADVERKAPT